MRWVFVFSFIILFLFFFLFHNLFLFCFNVELVLPPKPTTTSAPYHHTTQKPRRKQLPNHNVIRDGQNIHKSKDTHGSNNHGVDNENIGTIEGKSFPHEIFIDWIPSH